MRLLALTATGLLLTGCATGTAATPDNAASKTPSSQAASSSQSSTGPGHPSAAALMVCGPEIRGKVQQALALPALPATAATFTGGRYTCGYRLPYGQLVLSVQDAGSKAGAASYLVQRQRALHGEPVPGLGEAAFSTPSGVVLVRKDAQTLTVDATGLPTQFGNQQQKRTDLAYEVASDVLGCWTGND